MSTVKVNTVDKRTGSTLTLGGCGTTVTLGAGATQSGFGRTGTVDWCTTAKTAPFTGVSGKGYFVNTTCGAVTVTLPASPSAGDIVSIKDYGNTWQTNNLTVCNNGSKINGICGTAILSTQGQSLTLIYVDATKGWQDINDSTSSITGTSYITATGGTITTCGNYKIHTFTADGCFSVTGGGGPLAKVDYLVVAGGGSGGSGGPSGSGSGGAGAGGFRTNFPSGCAGLSVTTTTYPITVGAGAAALGGNLPNYATGNSGSNSVFSTITSTGGGGGGSGGGANGGNGGSGGGGGYNSCAGSGNTPPVTPPQGNPGGSPGGGSTGPAYAASGGGGAGAAGSTFPGPQTGGAGGNGSANSISGTSVTYAGGGGGSLRSTAPGTGGAGGTGGGGAGSPGNSPASGTAGTTNTGGGGGGGSGAACSPSGAGGSGIVIIRYRYQ